MMNGTNSTDTHLPSSGYFIALIIFACLCIIVGIIGNIGVIAYNISMNHSKTPTTYFVVNLAISDIIVCLTFFPPWLVEFISILTDREIMSHRLFCKVAFTSSFTSFALSVANLMAINIDRCIFITKPLKYFQIMTWKKTYVWLVAIWVLTIVNANLLFFYTEEKTGRRLSCRIADPTRTILCFFNIYIPSAGLLLLNYKIYKAAKNQRRKIRHESCTASNNDVKYESSDQDVGLNATWKEKLRQLQTIKTYSIVVGVFYCCVSPVAILAFIRRDICKSFCIPISMSVAAAMLSGANSVMNPFVYSSRNKEYKIAYRQFCARLFKGN
ncbi:octopamine receptor-like [Paramuricea clavata]|uniref:Octopamine receptor-like n=1 Tax=Paramuricea clavata TaxID=317549 RepID=A0A7D9E8V5_PARCT|nr:octopamine receptor-like [Paramuricea clavata]